MSSNDECRKWLSDWKCGVIEHDIQQDSTSCGIHVIEVCIGNSVKIFSYYKFKFLQCNVL